MMTEPETPPNEEALKKRIHKDIAGSALIGPFRVAIPILGYFILFPFIQQTAGLAVLGIWAQMRSLYELVSMGDVGFSTMMSREAGRDRSPAEREAVRRDFNAALRFYIGVLIVLEIALALFGQTVMCEWLNWDQHYDAIALQFSVMVYILAVMIQLSAALYASVLNARSDNIFINTVAGFMPLFALVGTAVGVVVGHVLEGFAIGALAGSLARFTVYRTRIVLKHKEWHQTPGHLPLNETWAHITDFMRRSWRFYSLSVGTILNEPVFRYTMGAILGAEAVGIYAIAHQVNAGLRMFVTGGLTSLLPGLAVLHRTNQRGQVIKLVRTAAVVLVAAASLIYGGVIMGGDYLYALWLGSEHVPDGIALVTIYIAFWYLITMHNVPFWRYMQASGNEGAIATCLWLHTGGILLLIPVSRFIQFDMQDMMIWWMAFGLVSQSFFFTATERRLGCVLEIVRHKSLMILVPAVWVFMLVGLGVSLTYGSQFPAPSFSIDWERVGVSGVIVAVYGVLLAYVLYPYGKDLAQRLRSRKAQAANA